MPFRALAFIIAVLFPPLSDYAFYRAGSRMREKDVASRLMPRRAPDYITYDYYYIHGDYF